MEFRLGCGAQPERLHREPCSQRRLRGHQKTSSFCRVHPQTAELSRKGRNPPLRHKDTKSPKTIPDRPIPNPLAIREQGPDGWTLLVNPDIAAAVAVNPTGALIWKLANGRRTVDGIIACVRRRFPDAPDSVNDDVTALLAKLSEAGLIGREIPVDSGRRTRTDS